ncbi:MAG: SUMF1/EgtB/PvdO family nonheme iron enzyme [Chthoniobacterales bacterium]
MVTGNRIAILIGVDAYEHKASWNPLPYVRGDIEGPNGMAHVLSNDLGASCNFRPENVYRLLGAEATSGKIEQLIAHICSAAGKDDIVLVYFSGHGIVHVVGDQPVLITYETNAAAPHKSGVTFAFIQGQARIARPKLILAIDACFSGRLIRSEYAATAEDSLNAALKAQERFGELNGLAVFASCQPEQVSRAGPGNQQSLFTQHLIAGLRGAGSALDAGMVTTHTLRTYLEEALVDKSQTPAMLVPQEPILLSLPERPLGEVAHPESNRWNNYLATFLQRYRHSQFHARAAFVDLEYEQRQSAQRTTSGQLRSGSQNASLRTIIPTVLQVLRHEPETVTVLLGDVGSGKTTLLRRLWFEMAEARLEQNEAVPLPIYISLNRFRDVRWGDLSSWGSAHLGPTPVPPSFRAIISDILQYEYNLPLSWATLPEECRKQPLAFLFDGLDEMTFETSEAATENTLRFLAVFSLWGARVLISCRTHFLRSDDELRRLLDAVLPQSKSSTIIKCEKFSPAQVRHYIETMSHSQAAAAECQRFVREAFRGTEQLARRPFLLEILVTNPTMWQGDEIDRSENAVFEEFLNAWLLRDRWRFAGFLTDYREAIERETLTEITAEDGSNANQRGLGWAEELVRHFIELLADDVPLEEETTINYKAIPDRIRHQFPTLPEVFLNFFEYVLRTCSFLVRDQDGNYGFLHTSIQAYFAACAVLRELRRDRYSWDQSGRILPVPRALGRRLLDPKVKEYLRLMLTLDDEQRLLNLLRFDTKRTPNTLRYLTGNCLMILQDRTPTSLSGANLRYSYISHATLDGADFTGVDLRDSFIEDTSFRDAVLEGAKIEGAQFVRPNLTGTRLHEVELSNGKTVVKDPIGFDPSDRTIPDFFCTVVEQSAKGDRRCEDLRVDSTEMALIEGGRFWMGTDDDDAPAHERPAHHVELNSFYMDIHPVTNRQFAEFVDANPDWGKEAGIARTKNVYYLSLWANNVPPGELRDHPVVYVSWFAAVAYAQWAGKRLPTEGEWEFALRSAHHQQRLQYPWLAGYKHMPKDLASLLAQKSTYAVRKGPANAYGLYDMSGNVNEWVDDWFEPSYWGARRQILVHNPHGPEFGRMKILRGGSFLDHGPKALRCSYRRFLLPHNTNQDGGFRCARDAT